MRRWWPKKSKAEGGGVQDNSQKQTPTTPIGVKNEPESSSPTLSGAPRLGTAISSQAIVPAARETRSEDNLISTLKQDQSPPSAVAPDEAIGVTGITPLWERALLALSLDKDKREILDEYKKVAVSELMKHELVAPESPVLDIAVLQRAESWLKTKSAEQAAGSRGRELAGNTAKAVSSVMQSLSSAGSTNPYVGLVCVGLCILTLPLLTVKEQHATLVGGLDQISLIMVHFNSAEQELQPKPSDSHATLQVQSELASRIVVLFRDIIEYQARAVRHYFHVSGARILRDFVKADDWGGLLGQIHQSDNVCSKLVVRIRSDRSESRISRQDRSEQYKLLKLLPHANAAFDDSTLQHQPRCHPGTRVQLLQLIENWSRDGQDKPIFWLKGLAGTGKSTIARTIASRFDAKQCLGASFFFARSQGDRRHAKMFFTTLAFQISTLSEALSYTISEAIGANRDIVNKRFHEQWRHLICEPLEKCPFHHPIVVVIDALDECESEEDIGELLRIISQVKDIHACSLRFFITSRPEIPVKHGFENMPYVCFYDYALHEMDDNLVKPDITVYLTSELESINRKYSSSDNWPSQEEVRRLAGQAGKFFIYAATACRFIDRGGPSLFKERLAEILEDDSDGSGEIDKMYTQILEHSIRNFRDKDKRRFFERFQSIVGAVAVLFSPLTAVAMGGLLSESNQAIEHITEETIQRTLSPFSSILDIPESEDIPIRPFHLSFRDFLLNEKRCKNKDFWIPEKKMHSYLVDCCLRLMSAKLKRNICGLQGSGVYASEVKDKVALECLPSHVQYACQYWTKHLGRLMELHEDAFDIPDHGQIHAFLKSHFLHWLEALSLMGKVSDGIHMILQLMDFTSTQKRSSELYHLLNDAKRFVLKNRFIIELAPLQIYNSALLFSPKASVIRNLFRQEIDSVRMLSRVEHNWSRALQILEGHSGTVWAVAFSPDGNKLASGSYDSTVRVWDVATGQADSTLKGHSDIVNAVVFSPDGTKLVSGSHDRTVRIWDVVTGQADSTLEGHSDRIWIVVFSPDGSKLASGSDDGTVRMWDVATGEAGSVLRGHSSSIWAVAFSPDGSKLASGSHDRTVRVWDVATGRLDFTLEGHSDRVSTVAFSPNGSKLASGSGDYTVRVWDVATGQVSTLKDHSALVNTVVFSPDGTKLASGSLDRTVRVWDVATGQADSTLEGHLARVNTVAFSPDGSKLVSGSEDSTIVVWDVATGRLDSTLEGHSDPVKGVVFSPDGSKLASGSRDGTVRVWDVAIGQADSTLEGHSGWVSTVVFSPDGSKLASGSNDCTVRVWDVATGRVDSTLRGHSDRVWTVIFSPNGSKLVSGSHDGAVQVWDVATGQVDSALEGYSDWVSTVAFSPDGSKLALGSDNGTVWIWDVARRQADSTLEGHSGWVSTVVFSPDGSKLASGSQDCTVRVWNVAAGQVDFTLEGHSGWVNAVAFSPDGSKLASGSHDRTVRVWDIVTGQADSTLEGHSARVNTVAFSPDGSKLASGSRDRTVRVWDVVTGLVDSTLEDNLGWVSTMIFSPGASKSVSGQKKTTGSPESRSFYSVDLSKYWVIQNGSKSLFLPPGRRPSCIAIKDDTLAIGSGAGLVTIIKFL